MKIKEFVNGKTKKKAIIKQINNGYFVDLFKEQELVRTVDVSTHSYYYAEDVAENWLSGILR